ncbi:acyloxyacyl hydrolase [Silvibacterium dinghuense]|uniref:Acyloxyacyl hydrolase n=2 Tax=Silvibacterium dinghuense TaxID=1560006 RepID=A0A4Q1SDU8_9BACT|nr:acyloxyacyl hydrolase [Silvibacterium dinghuense]RXS95414.1 acyloxyacyl hydrolase [Silvibacterium dinghuense]
MQWMCALGAALLAATTLNAQTSTPQSQTQSQILANDAPAKAALASRPWEFGPFLQGGIGEGDRDDFKFLSGGVRLGKVITDPHLGSIFRGQFEYAGEIMPYWQAFTPAPHTQLTKVYSQTGQYLYSAYLPYGGGTYTGVSITPIILRWNFTPTRKFAPWVQGAGGLIYTTHKFPPDILVEHGQPGGTSVFNFTPQFGVGFHYFVKPGQAIDFAANAIHISSASLGDRNPGVNASVQFQIGYSWWKK